jgi:hypothetical protein
VAHEAESQSPALLPAPAAASHRKRLVLLCCEDLRPVACALEAALRSRGWQVDLEFGVDARPWVQKVPPVRPSVRVLCVPGTVDRALAEQLRAAFRPDPEADLHILGVDDSPGLVHEIERLAGVRTPSRRPLTATPRLVHPTLVETQVRRERGWRMGAAAAVAAFALTLGGISLMEQTSRTPALASSSLAAGLAHVTVPRPADLDAERSRLHDPVLAAVGPVELDLLDDPRADDDVEIILLDDLGEPEPETPPEEARALETTTYDGSSEHVRIEVLATPLAGSPITGASTSPVTDASTSPVTDVTTEVTLPLPSLPAGFMPVAGLPLSDAAPAERRLPHGFLPVAGMTARPVTTVDPFATTDVTTGAPVTTIDPFDTALDVPSP